MKNTHIILIILLILVLLLVGPLLTIFALNTLFPALLIPYNFWTWLSVVILGSVLKARNVKSS